MLLDAKALAADARQLIADDRPDLPSNRELDKSAAALETLATSGNKLVINNEKKLSSTISDSGHLREPENHFNLRKDSHPQPV